MKHWKVYLEGHRNLGINGSKEIVVEVDSLPDISDNAPSFQQLSVLDERTVIIRTNSILRIESGEECKQEYEKSVMASSLRKNYLLTEKQSEKKYNEMMKDMVFEKSRAIISQITKEMKELASGGYRSIDLGKDGKYLCPVYYKIGKSCTDIANECKAYNVKKHLCNDDVMRMVYKKVAESLKAMGYDIEGVRYEHSNETYVKVRW